MVKGVEVSRAIVNKAPIGYKLKSFPADHALTHLGFVKEDIITEVNGQPLRSESDANKIFNASKSFDEVKISLLRTKQQAPVLLNYYFK